MSTSSTQMVSNGNFEFWGFPRKVHRFFIQMSMVPNISENHIRCGNQIYSTDKSICLNCNSGKNKNLHRLSEKQKKWHQGDLWKLWEWVPNFNSSDAEIRIIPQMNRFACVWTAILEKKLASEKLSVSETYFLCLSASWGTNIRSLLCPSIP